jgi:hypothetical protein
LLSTVPPFLIFVIASFGIITGKTGLLLSDLSLLSIFLMGFLAGKAIGGITRGWLDGALCAALGGAGYTQGRGYLVMIYRAPSRPRITDNCDISQILQPL